MGFFDFIKNGGLFGKMRGYDSDQEGHWYGFDEYIEDIKKCSIATNKTLEIPGEVNKTLAIGNNEKQGRIESSVNNTKRLEK